MKIYIKPTLILKFLKFFQWDIHIDSNMSKEIFGIIVMIFTSLLFLEFTKSNLKPIDQIDLKVISKPQSNINNINYIPPIPYIPYKGCTKKQNQDSISNSLRYASKSKNEIYKITGFCDKREYTYETLDEQRRRSLKLYINLALKQLNQKCIEYAKQINHCPFHFSFIEIINAGSSVDKSGNSRWRTDIMVQELGLHLSLRLILDFTVNIKPFVDNKGQIKTCAEYTTFPFPKYFIGYPTFDQMIPLPTQVISTGPGLVLSHGGVTADYPNFESLHLNRVWMENSDLALGTELPTTLSCNTSAAVNDTNLPSSKYPKQRFYRDQVQFPEKFYADCLETTGKAKNTDICNNYTWKPSNFKCTGKPENSNHYTGSSESYDVSMVPPTWPNGWIQPAKWRNKWPRLWSEPRDRFEYPSVPVGNKWNNIGVRYPIPEPDKEHPGIRWSTTQPPRTPHYWPTLTGIPQSGGPNYWLFNPTRGFTATQPHGGPG